MLKTPDRDWWTRHLAPVPLPRWVGVRQRFPREREPDLAAAVHRELDQSSDPDSQRIWWSDVGVHQNITFEVHPDPISGMHCWHQAVRLEKARPGDRHGDIEVDTDKAHASFLAWLDKTRPASLHSPDGTRRPYWLPRPLKPSRDAYRLPEEEPVAGD